MFTPQPKKGLPSIGNKWKKLQTKVGDDQFESMKSELQQKAKKSKSLAVRGLSFIDIMKQAIEKEKNNLTGNQINLIQKAIAKEQRNFDKKMIRYNNRLDVSA